MCYVANGRQSVVFYFDQSNPIMQDLLRLDYFEYARRVKECPETIKDFYSQEEIQMFEDIIYARSPRGRLFHTKENSNFCFADWIAIPGAIPAELVNGLCIHNENKTMMQNIHELSNMFPNATIFDQHTNILCNAKILIDEEDEDEIK